MRSRNSFIPSAFSLGSRLLLSHELTPRHAVPMSLSHELTATRGDGTSASPDITPGELANGPMSPDGLVSPSFIIKGTHLYQTPQGIPYPIHVYVTGPNDSTNPMDAITSSAVVEKMDQPISTGTPVPTWSP